MKKVLMAKKALLLLAVSVTMLSAGPVRGEAFRFGVMSDTQWKADLDGENPGTVAVGIIKQLNQQFIDAKVKFVIQVGDLTDKGDSDGAMETRAAAAQSLCDHGIAFFPLRGNHESSQAAGVKVQALYPQTVGEGACVHGATNFSSPMAALQGLSYSFDYDNARFVLLDQFTRIDGSNNNNTANDNVLDQLSWIEKRLASKDEGMQAFTFSHKNLIGANHVDTLFGSNPAANQEGQNIYYSSLANNGVRYHFGGHDHNHLRSIVASPDEKSLVQNIITSSNSYKFYTPKKPSIDEQYNLPAFGILRETPIVQELYTIGYYLVTVDGPRVSVAHFAADNGCGGTLGNGQDCDLTATPKLTFEKRETFGYSLNGKEFLVGQGESYTVVQDSYKGTAAKIVAGVNGSTERIFDGRATTKDVNTGWTSKYTAGQDELASNILTLWGMSDLGTEKADTFVLSMSYDKMPRHNGNGGFGLATKDAEGHWVNAVDMNYDGTKVFVHGPWQPGYGLGSYGIDPSTKTVWAVINYNGEFAAARDIEMVPGHRKADKKSSLTK